MAETDPLIEHDDYDDDDDEGVTNPFQSSTLSPSGEDIPLTTMNRERERNAAATTAETSFIEGSPISRVLASNKRAWNALTKIFPEAKATDIDASYSKNGRLQVKMFGIGKRPYELYTVDRKTGVRRLNPILPKQIKNALGIEREVLISQRDKDIEELHKSIREDVIIAADENEDEEVRERAREGISEK